MDEDADREPEPPARIEERRERLAELERQFRERRQELEEKAAADPWEFWPETHEDRYTALGQKSYKMASRRKKKAKNPWDDYVYFYTNADMDEYSVDELAAVYRNRWGIETGYRVLKEEFLPKSASPDATVRTFYFNFAAHLYNLWTAANLRRADDLNEDLSDGKQFTAGRFMQAIEDDPYDLNIPDEPSESRDVFDGLFL